MKKSFFLIAIFLLSCATPKKNLNVESEQNVLTREEAVTRYNQVEDVRYGLKFDLSKNPAEVPGEVQIEFVVSGPPHDLRLDFFNGHIEKLFINGVLNPANYNGHFILIPASTQKRGSNHITVNFTAPFSTNELGFSRFEDQEDKKVYYAADLERFNANKLFPSFDQVDIKGRFRLVVTTNDSDLVISNVPESEVVQKTPGEKTWDFAAGPKLSPSVFALFVGPYKSEQNKNLRILSRQTFAKYVDTKDMFKVTKEGIDFYTKYFDLAYPFTKYDQIILPHFSGAFETAAATQLSERHLSRGNSTVEQKNMLHQLLLHELAHQWLGNLVTMKWYNDLSLQEALTEFLSYKALNQKNIQNLYRARAYAMDEKSITHPLVYDVPTTEQARDHYDDITYFKGAAVFEHLERLVGENNFREGLAEFVKRYAFDNSTVDDLLSAIAKKSGQDLSTFKTNWILTSGFNTLDAQFSCENSRLTNITLLQGGKPLREHFVQLTLIESSGLLRTLPANIKDTTLKIAASGSCPLAIVPNILEEDYSRAVFYPQTSNQLLTMMSRIHEVPVKQQLWLKLFNEVQKGRLNSYALRYWAVREGLEKETDPELLRTLFFVLSKTVTDYIPMDSAQEKVEAQDQLAVIEDAAWKRLKSAAAGSDLQLIFFGGFANLAETKLSLDNVRLMLDGKAALQSFRLDQDMRWLLVFRLSRAGQKDSEDLIQRELKRDSSNRGQDWAATCRAAQPNFENKKVVAQLITAQNTSLNQNQKRGLISSLFPSNQSDLRTQFGKIFYDDLSQLDSRHATLAEKFSSLAPSACRKPNSDQLSNFLKKTTLSLGVQRQLTVMLEEGLQCQQAVALARKEGFRAPELPQVPDTHKHKKRRRRRR